MGGASSKSIRDLNQTSNYHLSRGVDLQNKRKWNDALNHFHEALSGFESLSSLSKDDESGRNCRSKIEKLKREIQAINDIFKNQNNSVGNVNLSTFKVNSQIRIANGDIGHTYESLFSDYMDNNVISVVIEDAYIQRFYQIRLFLRFCEFLVKTCPNLQYIELITKLNVDDKKAQESKLSEIESSLRRRRIDLTVTYSDTIHDREIRLNNGWSFIIGRGLDFYQPPREQGFYIGDLDLSLRKCLETTIYIHRT